MFSNKNGCFIRLRRRSRATPGDECEQEFIFCSGDVRHFPEKADPLNHPFKGWFGRKSAKP